MHITAHLHRNFDLPAEWTALTAVLPSGEALPLELVGRLEHMDLEMRHVETGRRFRLSRVPNQFFRTIPSGITEGNASLTEIR